MNHQASAEVRNALADPRKLVDQLGLSKGSKRQARGVTICCPVHGDRNPSCSVTLANGTVRVKCFSCDFSGDALTLIGVVHGLNLRSQFKEVLIVGAELGGLHDLADELRGGSPARDRKPPPPRQVDPEREYPPHAEVTAVWGNAGPVNDDRDASGALVARRLDPDLVTELDLARAIAVRAPLPRWARYQGKAWTATGHRMILRAYDEIGTARSLRAWRVTDGDAPKRLPPAGHKANGLVLANAPALSMLREPNGPVRLIVVEGEPDFAVRSLVNHDVAVIGLVSGSWNERFAKRVPFGSEVVVRTHNDPAGNRYAEEVISTLRLRCEVLRGAA